MTESTLSLTLTELRLAIAHCMAIDLDPNNWDVDQTAIINLILKRGLRQFYFPPPHLLQTGKRTAITQPPYEWSFLKPVTTLDLIGSYSTGTINIGQYATGTVLVSSGICTLTGGIWPSWASTNDTLTIGEVEYPIVSRDNTTQLTVTGDDVGEATAYTLVSGATIETKAILAGGTWPSWAATHGSLVIDNTVYAITARDDDYELTLTTAWEAADQIEGEDYTLRHNGNYDLPDDFGGLEGNMVYPEAINKPDIRIIGEGKIRNLRAGTSSRIYPEFAAIRPKKQTTTTTGQRFEIMFFPIPDVTYTLSYKMLVLPELLVDTTITHPYGGAMHSETILASCLAIVESQEDEKRGEKWQYFMDRLAASIQIDKKMMSADYFGYNRDESDSIHRTGSRRHPQTYLVTYSS